MLDKHQLGRSQYNEWLADPVFAAAIDEHIQRAYRESALLLARYAPLAAAKLVQLTESQNPETARKACLDIISMHQGGGRLPGTAPRPSERAALSPQTASRLLASLAATEQ